MEFCLKLGPSGNLETCRSKNSCQNQKSIGSFKWWHPQSVKILDSTHQWHELPFWAFINRSKIPLKFFKFLFSGIRIELMPKTLPATKQWCGSQQEMSYTQAFPDMPGNCTDCIYCFCLQFLLYRFPLLCLSIIHASNFFYQQPSFPLGNYSTPIFRPSYSGGIECTHGFQNWHIAQIWSCTMKQCQWDWNFELSLDIRNVDHCFPLRLLDW